MSRAIAVMSASGGAGKSTLCAFLAQESVREGYSCLLIDGGAGLGVLSWLLGENEKVSYDLGDACRGECLLGDAVFRTETGFYMMPSAVDDEGVTPQKISRIIEAAKKSFDFIICDCPTCTKSSTKIKSEVCDLSIICSNTDKFHLNSAAWLRRMLPEEDERCRLVITKLSTDDIRDNLSDNIDMAIDSVGARLLGVTVWEKSVFASSGGGTLPENCKTREEASNIVKRIMGEDIPLIKL